MWAHRHAGRAALIPAARCTPRRRASFEMHLNSHSVCAVVRLSHQAVARSAPARPPVRAPSSTCPWHELAVHFAVARVLYIYIYISIYKLKSICVFAEFLYRLLLRSGLVQRV